MWFLFGLLVFFAVGISVTAIISDGTGGKADFLDFD